MARAEYIGSSTTAKGVVVSAKVSHTRADGSLVSQFWTIQQDGLSNMKFRLLLAYESWRLAYAELARNKQIPLRYRTGDVYPKTVWALLKEILHLQALAIPLQQEKDRQKKLKEVGHGSD